MMSSSSSSSSSSQCRPLHHAATCTISTLYEDWFSRNQKVVKTLAENQEQQHSNENSNEGSNDSSRHRVRATKALTARSGLQGTLLFSALVQDENSNALFSTTLLDHCRMELAAAATTTGKEVEIYHAQHQKIQQSAKKTVLLPKQNHRPKANKKNNKMMEEVDVDAFFEACPEFMHDDEDEDEDESDQEEEVEEESISVKQQEDTAPSNRNKKKKKPSPTTTRNNNNNDSGSRRIVSAASGVSNPYYAHQSTDNNNCSPAHQHPQQQVQPSSSSPLPPQQNQHHQQRPSSSSSQALKNPIRAPAAAASAGGGGGGCNGAFSYTPIDLTDEDASNNNNVGVYENNGNTSRSNPHAPPPSQQQQQQQQQHRQQQQQQHTTNQYSNRPQQQQQQSAAASFPPPHANAPYNNNTHHQHQQQQQQHWQSAAGSSSSWDDHQSQNPFQTAREYARAGGSGGNGGHDTSYAQQDRNAPPPPPPPNHNNNNVTGMGGYNPYAQQQQQPSPHHLSSSSPPPPPAPVIRDSLRRKFQPPTMKRANNNNNNNSNGSSNNGVAARRPNSSSGGASSRNNVNSTGVRSNIKKTGGSGGNVASKKDNSKDGDDDDDDDELPEELKRFGKDLVEKIENEIMDGPGESISFDDIAGLDDAKQTIQEVICWPMKRPDLFTGLRRAPNGLLLYGPPGTGKTLIGKAIAHESGATFFSISSSSLTSKWIGEGEKLVRTLFAVAAVREPAVVFIDEIDSLLTQRKADENEASRRIKTEFLVQLDGATTHSGDGSDGQEPVRQRRVLTIGATNRPQELDEAARRRFVKRLYIPLPEEADREVLLHVMLKKNNHRLTDQDVHKMAKETKGFSGADLKALCTDAAMGPIRQLGARALEINVADVPPIAFKHFRQSLRGMKPSVAPSDLIQYEEWDKIYGSKRADEEDDNFDDDNDEEESTSQDGEAS